MTIIRARLSDIDFSIVLTEGASTSKATRMLLDRLPFEGEAVHAMWSGPLILCHVDDAHELEVENATTFLAVGDVVYHPSHFEIGIAYETTQFREPIGPVYVSKIGTIRDGLAGIVDIGRHLQRTGAKRLRFERVP